MSYNLTKTRRVALIDGDIVLFKAAWVAEAEEIGEQYAKEIAHNLILKIMAEAHCDEARVFLSKGKSFRYFVDPEYKANRKDSPRPMHLRFLQNWAVKRWDAEYCEGLEADDLISIAAHTMTDAVPVVCSIDKDLRQIPCLNFNWDKDAFPCLITREEAEFNLCLQMLMGDPTDGIKGLAGIGPKKALKLLDPEDPKPLMDQVAAAYMTHIGEPDWADAFFEIGYLVGLCRSWADLDAIRANFPSVPQFGIRHA